MALIWTKQLSVGNATLDSEHKSLMGRINCIEYAIATMDSAALLRELGQLIDGLHVHITNEERFAQAINFAFEQSKVAYQYLHGELQQTREMLEAKNGAWPEYVLDHYPQFLREWLIEHIVQRDMLMKPALLSRPYNFNPD